MIKDREERYLRLNIKWKEKCVQRKQRDKYFKQKVENERWKESKWKELEKICTNYKVTSLYDKQDKFRPCKLCRGEGENS